MMVQLEKEKAEGWLDNRLQVYDGLLQGDANK